MKKKRIALVTGGYSGEAEISYKSAITVANNITKEKFEYFKIDITEGGWYYVNDAYEFSNVNKEDFSIIVEDKKVTFDAVFMCIHGTPGEDGILQSYFDKINMPYTCCDATTSALTFNKSLTVAEAALHHINVAKSELIFKSKKVTTETILKTLTLPVFVKPNNGGSSIGISKVSKVEDLQPAINKAFEEDDQVLVEEFIEGREFTIGVFKTNNEITPMPITEVIPKKDFFDFEAKYKGLSKEITPAKVGEAEANAIREAAKKLYKVLNCKGVVRIDFILNKQNNLPYLLEVNTVPGQSAASIIPQQVEKMGWTLKDFYTALIEEALLLKDK